MKICKVCGKEYDGAIEKCEICGAELIEPEASEEKNEIIDYIFCYPELKLHLKELKESFPQTKILMINQL